jgi:hypothetical protein
VPLVKTPIFVFDSRENWFPVGVPESLEAVRARGSIEQDPISLDFPADMRQPKLPAVGYHRTQHGGGLHWHQFWLWYLYNPGPRLLHGVGRHEGDWEFVQLGCVDAEGDQPVLVTASQHKTGGRREAWACELKDGRPIIYVALGSHANYFAPGTQGGGQDQCDARGRRLEHVLWRRFGPWGRYGGRWGNSTGAGRSPQSPGRQGDRCDRPHLFHSTSR